MTHVRQVLQTLAMSSSPVLMIPDPRKDFTLETDASGFAIGVILSQEDSDGQLRPVRFVSRKMNDMEKNYSVHEEMLAIFYALGKLRHYLHGPRVHVLTDHCSLKYLSTQQTMSGRQHRWMAFLDQFDLDIAYLPGKLNAGTDALSRSPAFLTVTSLSVTKADPAKAALQSFSIVGSSAASRASRSSETKDAFLIEYDDAESVLTSPAPLDLSILDSRKWLTDEIIGAFFQVLEKEYAVKWLGPFALQQRATDSFVRKNRIALAIHSLTALHVAIFLVPVSPTSRI